MMNLRNLKTALAAVAVADVTGVIGTSGTAVSKAAECGEGTVYDAPSDTCVVIAQPLGQPPPPPEAPPPPPPAWVPTPHVSIGICAPIPFVALCAGI